MGLTTKTRLQLSVIKALHEGLEVDEIVEEAKKIKTSSDPKEKA